MKEKDLDKHLDNLIIDGLIKEAEQDNADFEAAMRKLSDEEFDEMIYEPTSKHNLLKWKVLRPWVTSAVAAAAVVLIVLIPSINSMNGKLCDSVLYASESYLTPSKGGFDVANASVEELKKGLPNLESRYKVCIQVDGKLTHYSDDLQEAGWDLTIAYLKLHRKKDAVKVLTTLAGQYSDTPFGKHCKSMLKQLQ